MIPPEPQNFGFKFPASGSVPVLFSSMVQNIDIACIYKSSLHQWELSRQRLKTENTLSPTYTNLIAQLTDHWTSIPTIFKQFFQLALDVQATSKE